MLAPVILIDAKPWEKLTEDIKARIADLSPWAQQLPGIIRTGAGSLSEQRARRTFLDFGGSAHRWRESAYQQGIRDPDEDLLFDAVEGRSPASVTTVTRDGCEIGVRDLVLKQLYAARGNKIVSTASYADFLLGGFSARTGPAPARPAKPVNPVTRNARTPSGKPKRGGRPKNITKWLSEQAMYWKLGWTYGYWPTDAELRAGLLTYPKNMGFNPTLLGRAQDALLEHLLGAGRLARGAALDPRRAM